MRSKHATRGRLLVTAEEVFVDKGFYEVAEGEVGQCPKTSKGVVAFPRKKDRFNAALHELRTLLLQSVGLEPRDPLPTAASEARSHA